jgi:hypothetical protein
MVDAQFSTSKGFVEMLWDVSSSIYQDWDKKMGLSGAIVLNLSYSIHCAQDTVFRANEVFVSGAPLWGQTSTKQKSMWMTLLGGRV